MSKVMVVFSALAVVIVSILLIYFISKKISVRMTTEENKQKHRVILIVMDALRHDYLELGKKENYAFPNLNRMATNGSRAMKMVASNPTVTMSNHQTLVTGLYTPFHGITGNKFQDSSMNNSVFSMMDQNSLNEARWYLNYPNPMWVTCEKHPVCRSGSMLWPNTDAEVDGYRPYRYVDQYWVLNIYTMVIYPYDRRVSEVMRWITEDGIDLTLLYFDEPDVTSHKYGPTDPHTLRKIEEIDSYLGRLLDMLELEGLLKYTDVVVTADHGMTQMSRSRVIQLNEHVPPSLYTATSHNYFGMFYPKPGQEKELYRLLSNASSHMKVYWRKDLPKDVHLKENKDRIAPIVTMTDLGWVVNISRTDYNIDLGSHGFARTNDDMKATFLAMGPSFKPGKRVESINNVDVYPLLMHLLGLKAGPNNGSLESTKSLLTESGKLWTPIEDRWRVHMDVTVIYLVLVVQIIAAVAAVIFIFLRKRGQRYQAALDKERKQFP